MGNTLFLGFCSDSLPIDSATVVSNLNDEVTAAKPCGQCNLTRRRFASGSTNVPRLKAVLDRVGQEMYERSPKATPPVRRQAQVVVFESHGSDRLSGSSANRLDGLFGSLQPTQSGLVSELADELG
jgi:hypothetical protein